MKPISLLCCINPASSIDDINEFTFYQLINSIGTIVNIKIFSKDTQVKAFVQMENQVSAEKVIETLNGKHMNIGRIKVFVSHKKFVVFDEPLSLVLGKATKKDTDKKKIPDTSDKRIHDNPYFANAMFNKFNSHSSFPAQQKQHFYQNRSDKGSYNTCENKAKDNYMISQLQNRYQFINKKIEKITPNDTPNISYSLQDLNIGSTKRYLRVSNFNSKKVNNKVLFNFFGCFGNVSKLLINKGDNVAILEFQNEYQAQLAVKHTDCIRYFGSILSVEPLYSFTSFDEEFKKSELYLNDASHHRFHYNTSKPPMLPTKRLLFIGIPSKTSADYFKKLVNKVHQIASLKPFIENSTENMSFLVEFKFVYESIHVLSTLHNSTFNGKNLYIRFFKKEDKKT